MPQSAPVSLYSPTIFDGLEYLAIFKRQDPDMQVRTVTVDPRGEFWAVVAWFTNGLLPTDRRHVSWLYTWHDRMDDVGNAFDAARRAAVEIAGRDRKRRET